MRCASPCGSEAPGSVTSSGAPAGRRGLISTTSRALSQSAPPGPSRDREQPSCSPTPRCSRPNSRRKPRSSDGRTSARTWYTRPPTCCTWRSSPSCAAEGPWRTSWRSCPAGVARGRAGQWPRSRKRPHEWAPAAPALGPRVGAPALREALALLPAGDRARLERVAERIRGFAEAQYRALCPVAVSVPGGVAEHQIAPVERAGCYAPGGRYPLPSSVLMTAVTARVAGVRDVWVASPKPHALSLAAGAIAGADGLLAAGGAHAIAALAYGAGPIAPRDIIVGPGNRYVTAAKQLVAGAVAIDMLAGPSELTVFADDTADAGSVAADLLAQAEHDPDALPVLVTLDPTLPARVEVELARHPGDPPTAETARAALANGGVIVVASLDDGIAACDAIAPEHLH